jgi:hypothetical protein
VPWSHLSAVATGFSSGVTTKPHTTGAMVSPGNGHVLICVGPDDVGDPPIPEVLAYEQQIRPEVEARLGPRVARVNPLVGTVFPNFSLLRATSRTFRTWHPRGPGKTEVWSWVFVDKAAPDHIKRRFGWPACAASARRARLSRTTWTIGRNARRPAAAWCLAACH